MTNPALKSSNPRIVVIIPHLNQQDDLGRCLDSLLAMSRRPDEIVVVDNGSKVMPDNLYNRYKDEVHLRFLQELEPGPGPARNLGIASTNAPVLAFIDADCLADVNWLSCAVRELSNPLVDILGGDVRISLKDSDRITMLEAYECIYAYRMERYISRENFTGTGNLVVRRSVLERVGAFGGLSIAEDRDWGQRAFSKGYKIRFIHDMIVYHPARRQFSDLFSKWDRHMSHDFILSRNSFHGLAKWAFKSIALGMSPLAEIPRILMTDRVTGLRSKILAFCGLFVIRLYRMKGMIKLMISNNAEELSSRWNRLK